MNVLAIPIGKASSHYTERTNESDTALVARNDIMYETGILYQQLEGDKANFNSALDYTATCYMVSFVKQDPSYEKFDVIRHYYVDIRHDESFYINLMKEKDKNYGFFDFSTGYPVLKDTYKAQFKPGLPPDNETDQMSNEGEKNFNIFKEKIFLSTYSNVFKDIEKNDLISNGKSFNEQQAIIDASSQYFDTLVIVSTYVSLFTSALILFLIVPLCNVGGKTISMFMMRIERVGINNVFLLKKVEVALTSIYQLIAALGCLLFIPIPNVPLNYVFHLSPLLMVSLIAAIIVIISFFILMFSKFNRTMFDYLSRTVMISSDSLDEIYRSKGYEI